MAHFLNFVESKSPPPTCKYIHTLKLTLPKLAFIFTLLFSTINITHAENSGIFIGGGIGSGGIRESREYANAYRNAWKWEMHHTFDWGIIAGYKHIFSENMGARIYGNLNFSHNTLENATDYLFPLINLLVNYTINADFLYNFYNDDRLQFGAFAGLGLGGVSNVYTLRDSINVFDIGLNIGLRASAFDNHSVELAVYVPFLPLDENTDPSRIRGSYRHAFSMLVRYVYSFDFAKKQTTQRQIIQKQTTQKQPTKYRKIQRKKSSPKAIKQPNSEIIYDEYDEYY